MARTKIVKAGTRKNNNIKIDSRLAHVSSFNENLFTKAGFKILCIQLDANASKVISDKEVSHNIDGEIWKFRYHESARGRLTRTALYSKFNKKLAALKKFHPEMTITIKHMRVVNKYSGNVYKLEVRGTTSNNKRVVIQTVNNLPVTQVNINVLMKDFDDLFEVTCYTKCGKNSPFVMCDSKNPIK